MINRKIINLEGVIDASQYLGEATITEFKKRNGYIDEEEINLLEVFTQFKGKRVRITIESEE